MDDHVAKKAWKFPIRFDLVGLAGLVVGVWGLYTYYTGTNPNLVIFVDNVTSVVDVNERVPGLAVFYQDEDLIAQDQALTIYSVSVENTGNEAFRKTDFDSSALVGVRLENAEVLSAQIDLSKTSSDKYLQGQARAIEKGSNEVFLAPVILDPGARVGFRIVAIHPNTSKPVIVSLGKVAGQASIEVTTVSSKDESVGLLAQVFHGGLAPNLIRLPIFFLGFLLLVIVPMFAFSFVSSRFDKWRRSRHVKRYFETSDKTKVAVAFAEEYEESGIEPLIELLDLSKNPEGIAGQERAHQELERAAIVREGRGIAIGLWAASKSVRFGRKVGMFGKAPGGGLEVDKKVQAELDAFLDFLRVVCGVVPSRKPTYVHTLSVGGH